MSRKVQPAADGRDGADETQRQPGEPAEPESGMERQGAPTAASEQAGGTPAAGAVPGMPGAALDGGEPEPTAAEGPGPVEILQGELAALRTELEEQHDKYLRLAAEFDNFKKRMRRDHEEQLKYALLPLLKDLLAVIDNLQRALDHASPNGGADAAGLHAGIDMVLKQSADIFGRYGMVRIKTVGEAFDPTVHEAMMTVEVDDMPEHRVIAEYQAGYTLQGRVVRPAMVSVSKRPERAPGDAGAGEPA